MLSSEQVAKMEEWWDKYKVVGGEEAGIDDLVTRAEMHPVPAIQALLGDRKEMVALLKDAAGWMHAQPTPSYKHEGRAILNRIREAIGDA